MDYAWGADIPGGVEARKQASPFLFAVHQMSKPGASAKHRRTATKGRVCPLCGHVTHSAYERRWWERVASDTYYQHPNSRGQCKLRSVLLLRGG